MHFFVCRNVIAIMQTRSAFLPLQQFRHNLLDRTSKNKNLHFLQTPDQGYLPHIQQKNVVYR